jgi:proteasome accessory factor C
MMSKQLLTHEKITLMLSMVPYLLDNGATSVTSLARHFDVDAATVRSIVRFFGVAGIPGETATYQHEDLFDIDWDALEQRDEAILIRTVVVSDRPRFSPREVAALLAGLQYLRSVPGLASQQELDQLTLKLTASTGQPASRIDVENSSTPQGVTELHDAFKARRDVEFSYVDASGKASQRRTSPIQLESVDNVWYLRAFCHDRDGERLFRVDRMSELTLTDIPSVSPSEISFATERPLYAPDDNAVSVNLRLHGTQVQSLRAYDPQENGELATILLANENRAPRVAAQAPGLIEVVSPIQARRLVLLWANDALEQYDE